MKSINEKERNSTFLRFLLFYLLTTGVIVLGIFWGYRVPFRQNDALKQQVAAYEKEKIFNKNFFANFFSVKNQIDTLNKPGVPVDFMEGQIDQKLALLNKQAATDSADNKDLYTTLIKMQYDIKDDKKTIRNSSNKDATVQQYMQDNATLKQSLKEWQDAYNNLKIQMLSAQR